MPSLKSPLAKFALFSLPPLFLLAGLLNAPVPLPSFALPERVYVLLDGLSLRSDRAEGLARKHPNALSVGMDGIEPLRASIARVQSHADGNENRDALPSSDMVLRDIREFARPLERVRIIWSYAPSRARTEEFRELARTTGRPIAFEMVEPAGPPRPILAASYRIPSIQTAGTVRIILGADAESYDALVIGQRDATAKSYATSALPSDRAIDLTFDPVGQPYIDLVAISGEKTVTTTVRVSASEQRTPRVLVATADTVPPGFVESLYPSKRIAARELETENLFSYELVVLDGVPLASLSDRASRALRDLYERSAGSLLFVADSPSFGREGDNPILEPLLPVGLLPRSLKRMPDMAVLLLLDRSGSMFGDKFSLAKVAGAELADNLKPTDLLGVALFSDDIAWLQDFSPSATFEARAAIEPEAAEGGTDLHKALVAGIAALERVSLQERHIIVVSDGITKPADFPGLVALASARGITISSMAVGSDYDRTELLRISNGTGGNFYRVVNFQEIPRLIFEDRMKVARTAFAMEPTAIYALDGRKVADIDAMSRFTPKKDASVLFADDVGDPLLASRESGERAVLVFASDQHGLYTKQFFASPVAVSIVKKRLDALFSDRPSEVAVVAHRGGASVVARGERLVAPELVVSGTNGIQVWPMIAQERGVFASDVDVGGDFVATVTDRGAVVARFPLSVGSGLGGDSAEAHAAAVAVRPAAFLLIQDNRLWLIAFFVASLAVTLALRFAR